jgi:hypothetical protein
LDSILSPEKFQIQQKCIEKQLTDLRNQQNLIEIREKRIKEDQSGIEMKVQLFQNEQRKEKLLQEEKLITGHQGEAFVFKTLINCDRFLTVDWPNKSNIEISFCIKDYENDKIYIRESGNHYGILAETSNGSKIFVEVKSTSGLIHSDDNLQI